MVVALVIGLLVLAGGRAGADTESPSPPVAVTLPLKESAFEVQLLPTAGFRTEAVLLTPRLSQQTILRTDPKHGWQFTLACYGYFRPEYQTQSELRFRVYAQQLEDLPRVQKVCRLLLRLQQIAWQKLRLQVNLQGERVLNIWLCRQGNAGGEQWRNNLYIYSIESIQHPVEWLREVAHEFSHALLPGITGFTLPEPWANGYMGERLFLSWIEPLVSGGQLSGEDLCDTSVQDIRHFVQQRCLPLRNKWLTSGLPKGDFTRTDAVGMGALIGLALYIDGVYGSSMLRATFARLTEPYPSAFWKAFTEALREAEEVHLTPVGTNIQVWLPAEEWQVQAQDRKAFLQTGKNRWQAIHSAWKLSSDGWYRLTSDAPLRLLRSSNTLRTNVPAGKGSPAGEW